MLIDENYGIGTKVGISFKNNKTGIIRGIRTFELNDTLEYLVESEGESKWYSYCLVYLV